MSDRGYVLGELAGIPDEATKRILQRVFEHVLDQGSFGEPDHQTKARNFRSFFERSTTATSTGEFSIAHGLPYTPTLAIPVIDVSHVGGQIVPLEVTRAADGKRIYLKSGSTAAPFVLLVE